MHRAKLDPKENKNITKKKKKHRDLEHTERTEGEAWLKGVKRLGKRKGSSSTRAPAMAPPLWFSQWEREGFPIIMIMIITAVDL